MHLITEHDVELASARDVELGRAAERLREMQLAELRVLGEHRGTRGEEGERAMTVTWKDDGTYLNPGDGEEPFFTTCDISRDEMVQTIKDAYERGVRNAHKFTTASANQQRTEQPQRDNAKRDSTWSEWFTSESSPLTDRPYQALNRKFGRVTREDL